MFKKWTSGLMLVALAVVSFAATGCSSAPKVEDNHQDVVSSVETQKDLGSTSSGRSR